jgi:hypothetical protein
MITYPVDVENTRWASWRISTAEIEKHNRPWPRHDGGEIVNLSPDIVPLLEVQATKPAFDPELQRLTRPAPVVDVEANTHTHGWTVTPLSQEELDDIAEREQAIAVYQDLKDGTGTQLQRLVRTERVCAYLLKDLFGAGQ